MVFLDVLAGLVMLPLHFGRYRDQLHIQPRAWHSEGGDFPGARGIGDVDDVGKGVPPAKLAARVVRFLTRPVFQSGLGSYQVLY